MSAWRVARSVLCARDALLIIGMALGVVGLGLVMAGLTTADPALPARPQPYPASLAAPSLGRVTLLSESSPAPTSEAVDLFDGGRSLAQSPSSDAGRLARFAGDRNPAGPPAEGTAVLLGGAKLGVREGWADAVANEDAGDRVVTPLVPVRSTAKPMADLPSPKTLGLETINAAYHRHATDDEPERLATPARIAPRMTILAPPR